MGTGMANRAFDIERAPRAIREAPADFPPSRKHPHKHAESLDCGKPSPLLRRRSRRRSRGIRQPCPTGRCPRLCPCCCVDALPAARYHHSIIGMGGSRASDGRKRSHKQPLAFSFYRRRRPAGRTDAAAGAGGRPPAPANHHPRPPVGRRSIHGQARERPRPPPSPPARGPFEKAQGPHAVCTRFVRLLPVPRQGDRPGKSKRTGEKDG